MKIRIQGNSLRFRLSKSEVDLFGKEGYLEEKIEFATGTFTYAVQQLFDGESLDASFTDQKITLFVPKLAVKEWIDTDVVGFSHHAPITENKTLFLLIEKDFKCIDGEVMEDQSDYYDNPVKSC